MNLKFMFTFLIEMKNVIYTIGYIAIVDSIAIICYLGFKFFNKKKNRRNH